MHYLYQNSNRNGTSTTKKEWFGVINNIFADSLVVGSSNLGSKYMPVVSKVAIGYFYIGNIGYIGQLCQR